MTVEDILRQTGFNDEQIKALDSRALSAFSTVLTTATAAEHAAREAKEQAELAQRAQNDLFQNKISPELDRWAVEKAHQDADLAYKDAEVAYYRTQAEGARAGGFIPKDAPRFTPAPARDANNGQFAPNPVPGSPGQYFTVDQGLSAMSNVTWAMSEHQRLYGEPMPDEFQVLVRDAAAAHLDYREFVARKYKFNEKKAEIVAAKTAKEREALVKETEDRINKQWSERVGNNPNIRMPQDSQFADIRKAQTAGQRKDPTQMTKDERRAYTQQSIQKEIAENHMTGSVH